MCFLKVTGSVFDNEENVDLWAPSFSDEIFPGEIMGMLRDVPEILM